MINDLLTLPVNLARTAVDIYALLTDHIPFMPEEKPAEVLR